MEQKIFGKASTVVSKPEEHKTPQQNGALTKEEKAIMASYLYKSLRIGDADTAVKLAERFKRCGMEYYISRVLIQTLGEDCCPEDWQRLYPTLSAYQDQISKKATGGHCLWHSVYAVATARKWYQTEAGVELEKIRREADKKALPYIQVPSWVYDWHTIQGRQRINQKIADLRLDGRWWNRLNILERWQKVSDMIEREHPSTWSYRMKVKAWVKSHYNTQTETVDVIKKDFYASIKEEK